MTDPLAGILNPYGVPTPTTTPPSPEKQATIDAIEALRAHLLTEDAASNKSAGEVAFRQGILEGLKNVVDALL